MSTLKLSNNSLIGKLPMNIYELSNLDILDCDTNLFSGTLSHAIGQLSNLQYLILRQNKFNGTIPSTIGNLSQLVYLRLSYNNFEGSIPYSLKEIKSLAFLSISSNKFTGLIPSWLSDLQLLFYLSLDRNPFISNTIPSSISNLTSLSLLSLSYTNLRGNIPYWIGDLIFLESLLLIGNDLTGTIPSSLSKLTNMKALYLENNKLNGSFPHWIGNLSTLSYLTLVSNHLTGTLPYSLSSLSSSLSLLALGYNYFSGTIPEWMNQLTKLNSFYLDNNLFTGTISSSLCVMIELTEIDFSANLLSSSIPDIFGTLLNLTDVQLEDNLLIGTIPSSISKLRWLSRLFVQNNYLSGSLNMVFNGSFQRNLSNIQLSNNQFTGELPEQLFLSSSLVSVSAVSNCFHGTISSSICMNNQLETLALDGLVCASSCRKHILPGISSSYVSRRSITGSIPDCLWSLPQLKVLHLSGNSLKITLPTNRIYFSKSISDLSLSHNLLTGSITSDLKSKLWSNLDLSHNRLSGTLDSSHFETTVDSALSLKNNRLSGFIPTKIHDMINIDILEGNYFDCKYDRSDLPSNDKNKDTYDCGSNIFNVLYYIWLGIFTISILVIVMICYTSADQFLIFKSIKQWLKVFDFHKVDERFIGIEFSLESKLKTMVFLQRYIATHEGIRKFSIYTTIFIIFVLLPIYTVLSAIYRIHTYSYAWTVALMYLSGKVAFGVAMSVLITFIIMLVELFKWTSQDQYLNLNEKLVCTHSTTVDIKNASLRRVLIIYVGYAVINLIVIGGVNIGYVIAVLYLDTGVVELIQILLPVFKLIWNTIIAPLMVRGIVSYLSIKTMEAQSILFFIQFVISIFNNIIIPFLIVMIISPDCFFHVFQPESDVTTTFNFTNCVFLNPDGMCTQYITYPSTTNYSPPFTYSYQCSSTFITFYAPVYVVQSILLIFIVPLIQLVWVAFKLPNLLFLTKLLYPNSNDSIIKDWIYIDEIFDVLVSALTSIGFIITFGTICPPLAVLWLAIICFQSYYHQAILGRFILTMSTLTSYTHLDILEDNLKVQPLFSALQKCGWFLLYTACGFYTLFLFDILGDSVGFDKAYWVLIVMPCIPLCIQGLIKCRTWAIGSSIITDDRSQCTEAVQLPSITSPLEKASNPMFTTESDIDRSLPILDIDASDRHGDSMVLD